MGPHIWFRENYTMWDHTLSVCRINSIFQILFMCCVGYNVGSNTDLQSSFGPTVYHLPLINHSEDWGSEDLYLCITAHGGNQNKENSKKLPRWHVSKRQKDGRWKKENISALIQITHSFRARTSDPLLQFHITISLVSISIWIIQNTPTSTD